MISRFLITTALEETWPEDPNTPVLFLGEWCRLYSRKKRWSQLNAKKLPYHWDDRKKLYKDNLYLSTVYESYLVRLKELLNYTHGCRYSERYWRILFGPWLQYFVGILYDRYLSIKAAEKSSLVNTTWIMKSDLSEWVPKDMTTFINYTINDGWNHFIYGEIIRFLGIKEYLIIDKKNKPSNNSISNDDESSIISFLKTVIKMDSTAIKNSISMLYKRYYFRKYNQIYLISTYFLDADTLTHYLGNNASNEHIDIPIIKHDIDLSLRENLLLETADTEFERLLNYILPLQIPSAYLEGYFDLKRRACKMKFPKRSSLIFTGVSWYSDEGVKIWMAERTEKGAKLAISQHGGLYGAGMWDHSEDHQIIISDRFYTWGWNNRNEENIRSMPPGQLTSLKNKINPNMKGAIIYPLNSVPRYSYRMFSVPVAGQMISYIENQIVFLKSVSKEVMHLLKLRLYVHDYGWYTQQRLIDAGFGKIIDMDNRPFMNMLNESRLLISTNNGTSFLEGFANNFPTLIFWDPRYWELRSAAQPFYDELRKVGILHYSSKSAAGKLNEIYEDPLSWWQQSGIQAAKDTFIQEFALTSENFLEEWKEELQSLTK